MSLYEREAKDEGSFSAEEKSLLDFYSSPLDRNGIRVSLDKVIIFFKKKLHFHTTFRLESIHTSNRINHNQHDISPVNPLPFIHHRLVKVKSQSSF